MATYNTLLSLLVLGIRSTIGLDTIVEIDQGQLLGVASVGLDDVPYVSYMGIPYAKQPVGDLRFRPPECPEPWNGILNATTEGYSCIQTVKGISLIEPTEPDQEACLYINVHTPANRSDDNLPVFFWVHGGSFAVGSGNRDLYGPDYLVSKGVILVTFNYRLDVFGFLSLDIPEAPGNIAQRDQVAALRWTRDNIAAFGGNPDAITIGGVSSGAVSAHLLSLSPMCEGLFQRVILMSGGALQNWGVSQNNTAVAFEMARILNYTTTDATELYNLLRTANSSDINKASRELLINAELNVSFQPVVEKEFCGVEPFLSEDPYDIIKAGTENNVEYLIGFTDREGLNMDDRLIYNYNNVLNLVPETWIPINVNGTCLTSEEISDIAYEIKSFYLGDQNASDSTINKQIDWASHAFMQYDTIVTTRVRSSASCSPIYLYNFAFDGTYNIIKTPANITEYKGVPHGEDLGYLFKVNSFSGKIEDGSLEDKVRRAEVEMWTNFIKYGDPTPEVTDLLPVKWLPTSGFDVTYMKIDRTLTLYEEVLPDQFAFWDGIYTELGLPIE